MTRSSASDLLVPAAVLSAAFVASATLLAAPRAPADGRAEVLLDNARVRIVRTSGLPRGGAAAVVVPLEDGPGRKKGDAWWFTGEKADTTSGGGTFVVVEPKPAPAAAAPPAGAPAPAVEGGSKPGDQTFKGISFVPLFENDHVVVLRARMEVGAEEAFHTHARDVVVVHLSGGAIEDTADGKTKVNRWKPGDVEFEARGSSHSARNVGGAIDVVLVTPKP